MGQPRLRRLALIYFSWPATHIPNAPAAFSRLPVERIAQARSWLSHRPEADVGRLGVVGGSKGGEYALLAASAFPWIRAATACVPSSIVWGGFGTDLGARTEGFTLGGSPVAHLPYGDYTPVLNGEITSAERHRRDRAAAAPDLIAAAAIPVERSRAHLLLISGGRDAVWPSDALSAEVVERMRRAAGPIGWSGCPTPTRATSRAVRATRPSAPTRATRRGWAAAWCRPTAAPRPRLGAHPRLHGGAPPALTPEGCASRMRGWRCCQTNRNLSPLGRKLPTPACVRR